MIMMKSQFYNVNALRKQFIYYKQKYWENVIGKGLKKNMRN